VLVVVDGTGFSTGGCAAGTGGAGGIGPSCAGANRTLRLRAMISAAARATHNACLFIDLT